MPDYIMADTDEEYMAAAMLFREYAAWLNIDLSFQHFEVELAQLNTMYKRPEGGIILCRKQDEFIGCVGIRKMDATTAELKRMYIKPAFQGQGNGKELLQRAVEFARSLHYKMIRLDTLNYMLPAINLYQKHGFYEIPAYYNNPNETAVFFELIC